MPPINPEITFGNFLTLGAVLFSWFMFVVALKNKVDLLTQTLRTIDTRLTAVENSVIALGQATIQLAKQETRLDSHAQRIMTLENQVEKLRS